jgi:phage tail P2-like protein
MSHLMPPNASALERHVAELTRRIDQIPTPIRDIWDPDTCPLELLPWLAWAFSVDAWKDYWSESTKRQVIKQAVPIARGKGSRRSVENVVKAFGANLVMREWWETTPKGAPHTFQIVINYGGNGTVTEEFQNDITEEIRRVKPARSHFTLSVGLSANAGVSIAGVVRVATFTRLALKG